MRLSSNTRMPAPSRRNVGYHTALSERDRETLDRIARRMGCSRADALGRAIRLLELVQTREVAS